MKSKYKCICAFFSMNFFILSLTDQVFSQSISVDNNTPTTPSNCNGDCTIGGGLRRGNNLFHSFENFNVDTNSTVIFRDPGVKNILNRVTGSNRSNILGRISVIEGNADLFLINPNGFLFGPNSSLNIKGSIIVTTANSIGFQNQGVLQSNATQIPNLTVNPTALFLNGNSGIITIQSTTPISTSPITTSSFGPLFGLRVPDGKSILLIGGGVEIDGGGLNAFGGKIELGSLTKSGAVELDLNGSMATLKFKDNFHYADVNITNSALLNVASKSGGDISIHARNINISNSRLRAGIEEGTGSLGNQSGDILLSATEKISIIESEVLNRVWNSAIGNAGNIFVYSDQLNLMGSAFRTRLDTSNIRGTGSAGDIFIDVTKDVSLETNSFIFSNLVFASGEGGSINVKADQLLVDGGSIFETRSGIQSNNIGSIGPSGGISIQANTDITFRNSLIGSQVNINGEGDIGNISINTPSLQLLGGAQISTSIFNGISNGGDITVNAEESILITGFGPNGFPSGLVTTTATNSIGSAGDITVNTGTFRLENGGAVIARTFNDSNAGKITINTSSFIASSGGQILNNTFSTGDAGDINLHVKEDLILEGSDPNFSTRLQLRLINRPETVPFLTSIGSNSGFYAGTDGNGKGGDINIRASKLKVLDGAVLDVRTTAGGEGGNIFIQANSFTANNGGQLVSTTEGSKSAGNITLEVLDSITLNGENSGFFANTTEGSTGSGGNINIDPRLVLIQNGAEISVNSEGSGPGGNISLQSGNLTLDRGTISATSTIGQGGNIDLNISDLLLLRNNSNISASAGNQNKGGDGGKITINTDLLVALGNSDITANAFTGDGGSIQINTRGFFLSNDSDITASSDAGGIDGVVEINNPEVDPSESLTDLPESVEPPQEITQGCRPGQSLGGSTFTHVGRGGLPTNPHQTQTPTTIWQDLRAHNIQPTSISISDPSPSSLIPIPTSNIIEAKGWSKDSQGRIYLTANVPQPVHSPQTIATC